MNKLNKLHNPKIRNGHELMSYLVGKIDPSLLESLGDSTTINLHCPCHHDENPSLALSVNENKALIYCFAGCDTEDILKVCGLKMSDLYLYESDNDNFCSGLNSSQTTAAVDKQHIQPVERISDLKSVFDSDKGTKGFNQRKEWKFEPLDDSDLLLIEKRYGFPIDVLRRICNYNILLKWIDFDKTPCWCVTDGRESREIGFFNVAQAVRLDGELFTVKGGSTTKKKTLPGSNISIWGGAYFSLNHSWHSENSKYAYIICEGITDYLAAWCLIDYFKLKNIMPIAVFGAQVNPSKEFFIYQKCIDNLTLILAFDNDEAGINARHRWYETLKSVIHIKCIDFPEGIKDLRDIFDLVRNKENPPTLEMLAEIKSYFDFDIDVPPIEPENQPVQESPLVSASQTAQSAQSVLDIQSIQEPQSMAESRQPVQVAQSVQTPQFVQINQPTQRNQPIQSPQPVYEAQSMAGNQLVEISPSVQKGDNKNIPQTKKPLPKETLPIEFPWKAVPPVMANYCQIAGYLHSTRPEWVFIHLLSACGVAVGKKFWFELRKGWIEPPIIWSLVVEDSGRNKSGALNLAVRFLVEKQSYFNNMARKEFYDEKAKYDMNRKNPKPVFKLKHIFIISDVTFEGLINNIAKIDDDTPAILIKAEELGSLISNFYTGKKDNTEHWIQCYGGHLEACMRKTEDSQVIPPEHGTIGITGGCQPTVFKEFIKKNMAMDNGLLWRFLIVHTPHLDPEELPKNEAEYKYTQTQLENATDALKQVFDELIDCKPDTVDMILNTDLPSLSDTEEIDPIVFNSLFSDEPIISNGDNPSDGNPPENIHPKDKTKDLLYIGTNQEGKDTLWEIEHDIKNNYQDIPAGAKGKAFGLIVRIASVFGIVDNTNAPIVEAKYLRNAYTLWKWLMQCLQTLLGNNETRVSQTMKEIEEYMYKQPIHEKYGLHFCTKRDLNRKFHSTRQYKEALRMLIEEGTLSEEINPRNFSSKLLILHPLNDPKDAT